MVLEMLVEEDGQVHEPEIYSAIVRNRAKLSYDTVARACDENASVPSICSIPGLREQLDLQLSTAGARSTPKKVRRSHLLLLRTQSRNA